MENLHFDDTECLKYAASKALKSSKDTVNHEVFLSAYYSKLYRYSLLLGCYVASYGMFISIRVAESLLLFDEQELTQ